jgi:hypothetical protein
MGWYLWHNTEQRVYMANDNKDVLEIIKKMTDENNSLSLVDAGGLAWIQMTEQD